MHSGPPAYASPKALRIAASTSLRFAGFSKKAAAPASSARFRTAAPV